jgi:hypothetical protein
VSSTFRCLALGAMFVERRAYFTGKKWTDIPSPILRVVANRILRERLDLLE